MEERMAVPVVKVASELGVSPAKKRGRPPLKKNLPASLQKKAAKAAAKATSEDSDGERDFNQVGRKNKRKGPTDSASEYDASGDESEAEAVTPGKGATNVRRSSRGSVSSAPQAHTPTPSAAQRSSSDTSGAFASYMSSAMMRRSRRSRTVDLSRPLVVMLPGDDPREVAQLDLRGEIEWDEFLLAMSEDTTFMTSDNEEGPEHGSLPHSSSTFSLSGMDGPPSRSRNSSATFGTSPLATSTTLKNNKSSAGLDAQQAQYNDVMSVNVAVAASEVYIPEVKEAALHKVLTAINLLDDPLRSSAASTASIPIPTAKARGGGKNRDSDLHELAQQVLIDKRCGGYDTSFCIMPEALRHTSEMYVDYDADSDDEQFVRDLQLKLTRSRSPRHTTTSPSASKKTASATIAGVSSETSSTSTAAEPEVEFKVRCLEMMMARLEREFELSRQFTSQQGGGTALMPSSTKPPLNAAAADKDSSSSAIPVPAGAPVVSSKKSVMVQLATTLEQAQASYELAKRFLKQPPSKSSFKKGKHTIKSADNKHSLASSTASSGATAARFTRHGNVAATPASDTGVPENRKLDFTALEKLHRLNLQRQNLPTTGSSANLLDLSLTLQTNPLVRASSVTEDAPPPPRRVGRPPLIPRIPHNNARGAEGKPPSGSGGVQKDKDNTPEEVTREPYEEYYTTEQIGILMSEPSTVPLLRNILRVFYGQPAEQVETSELGSAVKAGKAANKVGRPPKSRSNSIASLAESETDPVPAQVSVFGTEKETIIVHEVYLHWQKKRAAVSTSLIRAYHNYIMELWQRADSVTLPVSGDFLAGSLAESRQYLIQVRRSLDRARLITDRVRRRERLKRDILRLSGEQLDALRAELSSTLLPSSITVASPEHVQSSPEASPAPVLMVGSNPNGAVVTAGQGRDRTGKFLTAKQSMALYGVKGPPKTPTNAGSAKEAPPASGTVTASGSSSKTASVKSMRNQEIIFSVEPCSDDEASGRFLYSFLDQQYIAAKDYSFPLCSLLYLSRQCTDGAEESEISDDAFSSCASESESEAEPEVSAPPGPPAPTSSASASSTPVGTVKKEKGDNASSPGAAVKSESAPSSESAGDKAQVKAKDAKDTKEPTKELSPPASNSSARSTRTASTSTPETDSSAKVTPKSKSSAGAVGRAHRKTAILDTEDELSEDFDRTEHLSVRGGRSQQSTPAPEKTRGRSNSANSTGSNTAAASSAGVPVLAATATTRSTPAPPAATSSAKKTPQQGGDSSAKKGSNSRTRGVPDCSLRNLPFSASKTPAKTTDSAHKKRRL